MISTLKRRASRIGLANVKIMVTIDVMELIAPNDDSIPNQSMLSVCFERGGKISSTSNKLFNKEELDGMNNPLQTKIVLKSVVFPIYESVTIIATLYKDVKTGVFQEKTGKIILRQLKKNTMFNSESYKGLGLHDLRLDELVNDLQALNASSGSSHTSYQIEKDLQLDLLQGAILKAIITTNLLNEELEPQDQHDGELTSAMSFMIDDHNLPEDETIIGATFEDTKNAGKVNSKRRKSRMSYMLVNLGASSSDAGDSPVLKRASTIGDNTRIVTHSISAFFNSNEFVDDSEPIESSSAIQPIPESKPEDCEDISNIVSRDERIDSGASQNRTVVSSIDDASLINIEGRASIFNRDDVEMFQNTVKNTDNHEIIIELPQEATEESITYKSISENSIGTQTEPVESRTPRATTPINVSAVSTSTIKPIQNSQHPQQEDEYSGDEDVTKDSIVDADDDNENELTVASGVAIKKSKMRIKKIAANKEAFKVFNKEIVAKSNRISALEQILVQQSEDYQSKLLKLNSQLQLLESENKALRDIVNNVDVVRESIVAIGTSSHSYNQMLSAIAGSPPAPSILNSGNEETQLPVSSQLSVEDIDIADEYLKRVSVIMPSVDSAGSNGETITFAGYAKVSAELQTMKDEVQFLKNSLLMAQQAKTEETAAAREAASEAVRANMRRADMQQENEEVLEELIQIKMKLANLSIDYDQQKLLNLSYQRRIQVYAEQLTNMEVQETMRAHSIAPTESPFKARLNTTMNGKVVSRSAAVVTTSERLQIARRNSAKVIGSNPTMSGNSGEVSTNKPEDSVTGVDNVTVMVKL